MRNRIGLLELATTGWRSGPVILAEGPFLRWRGLRHSAGSMGLLLRTRSVHGLGMRCGLWAIPIDATNRVRAASVLGRTGLIVDVRAAWFLELPLAKFPPPVGSLLEARAL